MRCEIIQDLLPNYIDGLTSPVTNQEIENHLNECRKCRELFKDMSETVDVSAMPSKSIDPFLKIKESQIRKIILAVFITIAIVGVGFEVWDSYWSNGKSTFSDEVTISCEKTYDLTQLVFTPTAEKTSLRVGYYENKEVNGILPLVTLGVAKYHEKSEDDERIYQGSFDMIFIDEDSFVNMSTFPSIIDITEEDVIAVEFNEKTILINAFDLYDGKVTIVD